MATTTITLLIISTSILYLSSFFSIVSSRSTKPNLAWWCNQTPHPEQCTYFMSHNHHRFAPKHKSQFRRMTIQVALQQALNVESQFNQVVTSCITTHERRVWLDCSKLHNNTILQLKRTLEGLSKKPKRCTDVDAQTWLSTALTNIQICRSSSLDLNVSANIITPIVSSNLSQLVSNSLAVNGALLEKEDNNTQGFPLWFSRHDRKLLQSSTSTLRANLIVAKDGSGNYRTVQAALDTASKRKYTTRFIIHVKSGIYRENIEVGLWNSNIWLIGEGMRRTIITSDRSVGAGYTTYSCATAGIDGLQFVARDITFRNTAGPLKGQAVALRSASDLSVFYRCSIMGYQDTLFALSQRQFYRECYISGTIDFIFGNAAVVFQNSVIYVRKPLTGQANVITAQGRYDPFQNTGISIHNSRIVPAPDLRPVVSSFTTYLGRPWMQYSRTVIIKSYLDGFITPAGWSTWDNSNFALDTLYYGEYKNFGPGSSIRNRVNWKGYHVITRASMASPFTVKNLIAGQSWLPATGVPYTLGL